MIMTKNGLNRIDAIVRYLAVKCIQRRSVLVVVVRDVLRFASRLCAIVSYRRPGNLDRQQAQHEKDKKATHAYYYSGRQPTLSIFITT